jgi:hypothetical protein
MAFTVDQQTQFARFSSERKAELTESKFEKLTPDQIRAKVNVLSVSDVIRWAPECNYTTAEKEYVEAAMPRNKWAVKVPLILAEAAVLAADGASVTLIKSILKGR